MLLASILFSGIVSLSHGIEVCTKDPCSITVSPQETIVCGCGVSKCELNVIGNIGKDINLISYATTTELICNDIDSCQGANVDINPVITNVTAEIGDIDVTVYGPSCTPSDTVITCLGQGSCKDMNITSNSVSVTVTASGLDSFDEAGIYCDGVTCSLVCSDTLESCEGALCGKYCDCVGYMCPDRTEPPTISPLVDPKPIPTPTVNPVVDTESPAELYVPDYTTCTGVTTPSGICSLSPSGGDIIVVTNSDSVSQLIIDCSESEQCKENNGPLVVYSAANLTTVICGDNYQSCAGAIINIGEVDEAPITYSITDFTGPFGGATVECNGVDACKEVNVTINGNFATNPVIAAMGINSFSEGCVECDLGVGQSCILSCNVDAPECCDQSLCKGDCEKQNLTLPAARIKQHRVASTIVTGTPGGSAVTKGPECTIDCSAKDQCKMLNKKGFTVNSECDNTIINCGESSCKFATFNIGSSTGTKNSASINCEGSDGCYGATINIIGNFMTQPVINGITSGSLKSASIDCEYAECIVECDNGEGCDDLLIDCSVTKQCTCNGGSCMLLDPRSPQNETYTINTPAPTATTGAPTPTPTPKPTAKPTTEPTSSDLIVFTAAETGTYICKNNVKKCILDCNDDRALCDEGVILLSSASNTDILCDAEDTCKNIKIYLGSAITSSVLSAYAPKLSVSDFTTQSSSATINCSAPTACKESLIAAGSVSITIETHNATDALKSTVLDITSTSCQIDCGGPACMDTIFTNIASCSCEGETCPTLRQSNINNIPNNEQLDNNNHYPSFLPTAIIICISFGLICLISFCLYYKYFTNKSNEKMLNDNFNDYNVNDTYQAKSLEMESYA